MREKLGKLNEKVVMGLWNAGNIVFAMMLGVSFVSSGKWETLITGILVLIMSVLLQRMLHNWLYVKKK